MDNGCRYLNGKLFRRVSSAGRALRDAVTEKPVWHVVKEFAAKIGVTKLAPHDLRRSCARLCRAAGENWSRFNSFLAHLGPDHGTLSRLRPKDFIGRERQNRNRAGSLNLCPRKGCQQPDPVDNFWFADRLGVISVYPSQMIAMRGSAWFPGNYGSVLRHSIVDGNKYARRRGNSVVCRRDGLVPVAHRREDHIELILAGEH